MLFTLNSTPPEWLRPSAHARMLPKRHPLPVEFEWSS